MLDEHCSDSVSHWCLDALSITGAVAPLHTRTVAAVVSSMRTHRRASHSLQRAGQAVLLQLCAADASNCASIARHLSQLLRSDVDEQSALLWACTTVRDLVSPTTSLSPASRLSLLRALVAANVSAAVSAALRAYTASPEMAGAAVEALCQLDARVRGRDCASFTVLRDVTGDATAAAADALVGIVTSSGDDEDVALWCWRGVVAAAASPHLAASPGGERLVPLVAVAMQRHRSARSLLWARNALCVLASSPTRVASLVRSGGLEVLLGATFALSSGSARAAGDVDDEDVAARLQFDADAEALLCACVKVLRRSVETAQVNADAMALAIQRLEVRASVLLLLLLLLLLLSLLLLLLLLLLFSMLLMLLLLLLLSHPPLWWRRWVVWCGVVCAARVDDDVAKDCQHEVRDGVRDS
jgi:hypothetical protein